jgi:hypothetical protein
MLDNATINGWTTKHGQSSRAVFGIAGKKWNRNRNRREEKRKALAGYENLDTVQIVTVSKV